jgi:glycosyltransferase involved in cell wall biosynthesis
MRVLHLYSGNLYGGVERLLQTLARHAAAYPWMRHDFALCFDGRLSRELQDAQARVHQLGRVRASRPWSILWARRTLAHLLERQRFDVVVAHACWSHAVFGPQVRRSRTPLAFFAHDRHTGRHWLERWAGLTRPDLVLAGSRYIASTVKTVHPTAPVAVAVPPVAPPDAHLPSRASVRQALGEPEDAVVIAIASRLEEWKGHRLLLAALAQLRNVPQWSCWIIGGVQRPHEAGYLQELHALARRDGIHHRLRFLGQRSDVPALLASADIHCQPNTVPEPFGIAFIEAMYARLPIVTTAMGGPLEYVTPECGVLVPADDPSALSEALRRLIHDPASRHQLGQAAHQQAEAVCQPRQAIRRLNDHLEAMLPVAAVPQEVAV